MVDPTLFEGVKVRQGSIFSVPRCWCDFIAVTNYEKNDETLHSSYTKKQDVNWHLLLLFSVKAISDVLNDMISVFTNEANRLPIPKAAKIELIAKLCKKVFQHKLQTCKFFSCLCISVRSF